MIKVITYGTYDLLHQGHINLLRRAKELGDYLIVGVTSDSFDRGRGKLNVRNNVLERVAAVKATGYADEVIIEDYLGQKIDDIQKYDVDIFAIGSDWVGKFDYLNEYCKVVYLPRTEGISSTMLRAKSQDIYRIGVIGSGRIAHRFVPETNVVNGAEVVAVLNPDKVEAEAFATAYGITPFSDFDEFISNVDAVYIASPHLTHYDYAKRSLLAGKHVLCEIPFTLSKAETEELYRIAEDLYAKRPFELVEIKLLDAFHAVADQAVGGDELGINQISPKQLANMAERRVGDILHRSQQQWIMLKFQVGNLVHLMFFVAKIRTFAF